jgi:hypothetical protein
MVTTLVLAGAAETGIVEMMPPTATEAINAMMLSVYFIALFTLNSWQRFIVLRWFEDISVSTNLLFGAAHSA